MNIRIMTSRDYDQVYFLWMSTPNMGINRINDSKEGVKKYLDRNPNTCFVAEKDGKIVGVILSGHDGRRGFIHYTVVDGSEQRQGIGTALVDAAMEALKNEGIKKVGLVAFKNNEEGNSFWEKQGFFTRNDLNYLNKAIVELKRIDT